MIRIKTNTLEGYSYICENGVFDAAYPNSKTRRGRVQGEGGCICPTIMSGSEELCVITNIDAMENRKMTKSLIESFSKRASQAAKENTYDLFLLSLLDDNTIPHNELDVVYRAFLKYNQRPNGKGWCFDFDSCKWFRIRKLTPRTCFRLMDVRDKEIDKLLTTQINKKGIEKQVISNSRLYMLAGNSIVVSPMALTLENIFFPDEDVQRGEQLQLF